MKILIVQDYLRSGGTERHSLFMATAFAKAGHEVTLLTFFNAVLKPLLLFFTLPFIILTLGIGIWLINALLFYFAGRLVDGFHVVGFGAALFGALIVSVTNMVMSRFLKPLPKPPPPPARPDDVIDI